MTFTNKNWWQRAAIVALGLALAQTDDGLAAGPGKGGGLAGLRDRLGQAERPALGSGNSGKSAGPRVNNTEAKPRPNIFEQAGRIGKPASQPQATHQGRGVGQTNLFNQLKDAAATKGPRRPEESSPTKTSGRVPPATNQNLGNLLGGIGNNRQPGKASVDSGRQPAAANALGQLLKDRGPVVNRPVKGETKSPATGLGMLKQQLGQKGNAGSLGTKAQNRPGGKLDSLNDRLPGLSSLGRPTTKSPLPKLGGIAAKRPTEGLGTKTGIGSKTTLDSLKDRLQRPGSVGSKNSNVNRPSPPLVGKGGKLTDLTASDRLGRIQAKIGAKDGSRPVLETLKGRLPKTAGGDLKTKLVNRPFPASVGLGGKLKELTQPVGQGKIQAILGAKGGSLPLLSSLLQEEPAVLDNNIVVPDQTQIVIDNNNNNTVIGVPGQGAAQAINLATSIIDLIQTAVATNGLQGTGVETLGGGTVDCPPVTGTVDCPPTGTDSEVVIDDSGDSGSDADSDSEMVDGEDLTDGMVDDLDSGLGDDIADGTDLGEDAAAEYTVLVVNVTERPMTYSVRRAGSVWGTYELPAGEEHRFVIPTPELEVRYTTDSEPTTISVPGDHVYAFAEDNGTVSLFLADEE
ncbi:MAG: hypothetical protein KF777_01855 [Planctomycetaceae bacterium]|nr:hypothetical protein [Planctomycetaceae bacterium]